MEENMTDEFNTIVQEFMNKLDEFEVKYGGNRKIIIKFEVPPTSEMFPYQNSIDDMISYYYKEIDFRVGKIIGM